MKKTTYFIGTLSLATLILVAIVMAVAPTRLNVVDGWDSKNGKTLVEDGKVYIVTASDNQWWETEKGGYYTSYQFSDINLQAGQSIYAVRLSVEHWEEQEFVNGNLEWNVGTGWPNSPTIWGTTNPAVRQGESNEATDSWDVSSIVDTQSEVNSMELRVKNNDNNKKTKADYVYADVAICGNNGKELSEVCDGTDLGGQTCVSQGFDGGTLACNSGCSSFNTAGCYDNTCSDTDGGIVSTTQGTASGNFQGSPYSETDFCTSSTNLLEYYCGGDRAFNTTVNCAGNSTTSCSNGACV